MKTTKRILLFIVVVSTVLLYFAYFAPTKELGTFSKFVPGREINQLINVAIVQSKGFERDDNGGIISFYVKDKDNIEAKVTLHKPATEEIDNAKVVELLGHMHKDSFIAASVYVVQ
ncbi:MAG: hypothetical protein WDA22_10710 [Bacteroidota bacterium]